MSNVSWAVSAGVAEIMIQREPVRNALNAATIDELIDAFARAERDQSVAVIVLSGAGQQAFCSGADLRELVSLTDLAARESFFARIALLVERIGAISKPVIAKVHGAALAGGCGLAAAADIVLASDDATFGLPEVKIGLVPMVVLAPIERAVGRKAAAYLALTGESITAHEALQMSLISRVVPKAQLDEEAAALARRLASYSRDALNGSKQAVYDISEGEYFDLLKQLPKRIAFISNQPEATRRINDFLSKRKEKAQ